MANLNVSWQSADLTFRSDYIMSSELVLWGFMIIF